MLKVLRDELSLLGLLIVLVGISATESYYGFFGLRYQFLSLPAQHILYRGLASILDSWLIALCYISGLAAIATQSRLALLLGGRDRLRFANYLLVILLSVIAWLAASVMGADSAVGDATMDRSGLPKITKLISSGMEPAQNISDTSQGYHLLLHASEGIYLIRPIRNPASEQPIVHFVPGGSIEIMSLCTRC